MKRAYITFTLQAFILLLLQAVIMNHVRLFGYFTPIIFLYPVFKLPILTPKWTSVLLGSILGFLLDLLMNTPGINMSVGTLIGLIRSPILLSFTDEDMLEDKSAILIPSFSILGSGKNLLYLFIMTALQIASLMLLEAFSVDIYVHVLPSIIGSTAVSYIIFLLFDIFLMKGKA